MKKYIALLLAAVMVLSMAACGKKPADNGGTSQTEAAPQQTATVGSEQVPQLSQVESMMKTATSGASATITVSGELKLEQDAWLGLCPSGKTYITEEEADDVVVIWFAYDGHEEGDPYVFSCDFSDVEDGTYALVLTNSDDAAIGYVVLQLQMIKKGDSITFDYKDAVFHEAPEGLGTTPADEAEGTDEIEGAEEPETIEGDPVEYGREYWEEKYPGENICPFSIEIDGKEYSYYWVSNFNNYDGTIVSWLEQPFNWNGWHMNDDGVILNEDETVKITDDWANGDEGMSSFCTITTEKYEPAE